MATQTKRLVTEQDGLGYWELDWNDVTLRVLRWRCVNNTDHPPLALYAKLTSQAPERADLTAYAFDTLVQPAGGNGRVYRATVGGTSGAAPPSFPVGTGQTVVDGSVTWQCIGPLFIERVVEPGDSFDDAIPVAVANAYNLSMDSRGRLIGIISNFSPQPPA